jgi:hypothetical protein
MTVWLRISIMLVSVLLMSACGSEDVAKPGDLRTSGVTAPGREGTLPGDDGDDAESPPEQTPPVDEQPPAEEPPVDEEPPAEEPPVVDDPGVDDPIIVLPPDPVEPPLQAVLDTNVFFPIIPGMQLFFDASTVPTVLGAGEVMGDDIAYPLQQSDLLFSYFTSTADLVGLKSVRVLLLEQAEPVFLTVSFAESRPILGDASSYSTTSSTRVQVSNLPFASNFNVRVQSTLQGSEWFEIPGLAPQPARHIRVTQQLSVNILVRLAILANYPWLYPVFEPISFDLWLVPGIGIVKVQQGNLSTQVQAVAGVPEPLVFSASRNASIDSIAPQTLLVDGTPVTDISAQPTLYYRTAATDWLDVQFDGTGSWRAYLTRTDLPAGVHAATVRFSDGESEQDVTVSLMIE